MSVGYKHFILSWSGLHAYYWLKFTHIVDQGKSRRINWPLWHDAGQASGQRKLQSFVLHVLASFLITIGLAGASKYSVNTIFTPFGKGLG